MNARHLRKLSIEYKRRDEAVVALADIKGIRDKIIKGAKRNPRSEYLVGTKLKSGREWVGPGKRPVQVSHSRWESEESAQRQIYLAAQSELVGAKPQTLLWLDYELPTRPREAGTLGQYLKVDLLGAVAGQRGSTKTRCFVELKYGKPKAKGESPVAALVQALAYVVDAHTHTDVLALQKGRGLPDAAKHSEVRFPHGWSPAIVVAGNQYYWEHWENELGNLSKLKSLGREIEKILRSTYPTPRNKSWVRFASFPNLKPENHPKGKIELRAWAAARKWKTL